MRSFGIRVANSARIPAVPSVDWSFTTMTSPISGCAATDSTARAIDASSFRAGITAETIGGYSGLLHTVIPAARSAVEGNRAPTPSVGDGGEAGRRKQGICSLVIDMVSSEQYWRRSGNAFIIKVHG